VLLNLVMEQIVEQIGKHDEQVSEISCTHVCGRFLLGMKLIEYHCCVEVQGHHTGMCTINLVPTTSESQALARCQHRNSGAESVTGTGTAVLWGTLAPEPRC
jgi:hypothetical protein